MPQKNIFAQIKSFSIALVIFVLTGIFFNHVTAKSGNSVPGADRSAIEFEFTSSYDSSVQRAAAYIPAEKDPRPLIVVAHYYYGNRFTAQKQGYYEECEKRGWYVVCPELHGKNTKGQSSFASLEAQRDIIDAITYMKKNYAIDTSRIYIAGRSMGGMLAQIMAAKYPDVFAAAVAGQGISNLHTWIQGSPTYKGIVEKECGVVYEENPFEYQRRSSRFFSRNFAYVPLILWHGTNDYVVAPSQSKILADSIRHYYPYQPAVHWLHGAPHCGINFDPLWVCIQLQNYRMVSDCKQGLPMRFFRKLNIVTDESKPFFWLDITLDNSEKFGTIVAEIDSGTLAISTTNVQNLRVNFDLVPRATVVKNFDIKADRKLTVSFFDSGSLLKSVRAHPIKKGAIF